MVSLARTVSMEIWALMQDLVVVLPREVMVKMDAMEMRDLMGMQEVSVDLGKKT